MSPRTGRPTDNPKLYKFSIRFDEQCKSILKRYCEQEKVSQTEAVRRAIKLLEQSLKKK